MSFITLLSPAKINLTLEVLGKRADGYHEIRSLMQPVNLFDEVRIQLEEGEGIEVDCKGIAVPGGRDNLAWKAARLFLEEGEIRQRIKIFIDKKIPAGAGLGGGSGNAAAVLVGANKIMKRFGEDELIKLSSVIGADVPFFIRCRTAMAQGVGEKLTLIQSFPLFHYVLLNPGFQIATKKIYELWDVHNPGSEAVEAGLTKDETETTISLFRQGSLPLRNDLENIAAALHPQIMSLKETLSGMEAEAVSMTGSGSTVFGIFKDEKKAKIAYDYLKDGSAFKAFLARGISGWHRL